jgi:hypothetical protein
MSIFKTLQETFQYIWEGAVRIFAPRDDEYPEIGVQPFSGDAYEEPER